MGHKYKVGDVVQVRSDLKIDRTYGGFYFIDEMEHMLGMSATIKETDICGTFPCYKIKESPFCWTDEMFEDSCCEPVSIDVSSIL